MSETDARDSGGGFRELVANLSKGDTVVGEINWAGTRHIRGEFRATVDDIEENTGGPTPDQKVVVIPVDEGELRLSVLHENHRVVLGPDIEFDGRPYDDAELDVLSVKCRVCKTLDAETTETAENPETGQRMDVKLCTECLRKGKRNASGSDVSFSDELRLRSRSETA